MHFTKNFGYNFLSDTLLLGSTTIPFDKLRANHESIWQAIALYTMFITVFVVHYVVVAGFFKHGTPCTNDMHLPQDSTQQFEVPHIIDAVYSIVHGLQNHITKYCSSIEFCSNAR